MHSLQRMVAALALSSGCLSAGVVSMGVETNIVAAGTITDAPYSRAGGGGAPYSGVAKLLISTSNGTSLCTGSVIGAATILTAGHCLTSPGTGTVIASTVTAILTDGISNNLSVATSSWVVHPTWNGSAVASTDLAVINFASAFPSWVSMYALYDTFDEIGQNFNVAGYGMTGSNYGPRISGTQNGPLRQGQNRFDANLNTLGIPGWTADVLMADFDNGSAANDAFGAVFGINDLGLGLNEVATAPGDSGGPSFINGKLAGVTSFGTTLMLINASNIVTVNPDCNGSGTGQNITVTTAPIDSTCGEFMGMVRVSTNAAWIQASSVPEPSTYVLAATALAVVLARRRRARPLS